MFKLSCGQVILSMTIVLQAMRPEDKDFLAASAGRELPGKEKKYPTEWFNNEAEVDT